MNYIEYKKGNKDGSYCIMATDNDFPNELRKVMEDKDNTIIDITVDGFTIEDYQWILNYTNDNWTDEYCGRLKNHNIRMATK